MFQMYHYGVALMYNSLVDSRKNISKSEERMTVGIFVLLDTLFHIKNGTQVVRGFYRLFLMTSSIDLFEDSLFGVSLPK